MNLRNVIAVENMLSIKKSGSRVANQMVITTDKGTFFKSYEALIAFKPNNGGKIQLDKKAWEYSRTTNAYRGQFLGEGVAETRKKIAAGEYELVNLNA